MDAGTVIDLLGNGALAVGLWAGLWHLDRRLIRLETRIDQYAEADTKE